MRIVGAYHPRNKEDMKRTTGDKRFDPKPATHVEFTNDHHYRDLLTLPTVLIQFGVHSGPRQGPEHEAHPLFGRANQSSGS
jgi:hypothetical protein